MSIYVGMDVHRKRSQVAVLDDAGVPQGNRNVPNDPAQLVPILGALPPGTPVAFEAADGWGWLVDLLEELEPEPHLVHPSRGKAIASARLQERQGRRGHPGAAAARRPVARGLDRPQQVRDLRALLRHRASLVGLVDRGQESHPCGAGRPGDPAADWAVDRHRPGLAGRARSTADPRAIVEDYLALLDGLAEPITRLEHQIHALAKPDPGVQALMALPGVGQLTAMMLVAEIGDIARFPTARKLCAWARLTPQVGNSDRTLRHGHITKQGSPWVRWILQEAAQTAKRSPLFAPPTPSSPAAGASRSPPWRSPAGCWPALSTSSISWRPPPPPEKAKPPGVLVTTACACNTAVALTEQPGPDSTVMRTPTRGPNGCV